MKINYQWLRDFIDGGHLPTDSREVANALTMIGLAVEGISSWGQDMIFDLDVTSNRPDCLNHLGVARELAARFRLKLKKPYHPAPEVQKEQIAFPLPRNLVIVEEAEICPRYAARVLKGVQVGESPDWLKSRLESIGQRPVNNIVDITNYVIFELGHPLHAFDYEKLSEHRVVVRAARAGEKLRTLDQVERELETSMLVICDARAPIALGGIMGGLRTEISSSTRTIFLESAYFRASSIRNTSRRLGIRTEASFRFERGADPEAVVQALNRACCLIEEIAGGCCVGSLVDQYPNSQPSLEVNLRQRRMQQVMGIVIAPSLVEDVFSRLEFEICSRKTGAWRLRVPSFRVDVKIEEDLVEEVARHYGYDQIKSTYPPPSLPGHFLPTESHNRLLTKTLEGMGFFEVVNYVFTNLSRETHFWGALPKMIPIANPLSEEGTHLRTSLVPGLVESLRRNLNYGTKDVRLFEFGKVFLPDPSGVLEDLQEVPRLGLIATGAFYDPFWSSVRDIFEFYHFKGVIEALLAALNLGGDFLKASDVSFLHPGAGSAVVCQGQSLGVGGELHPKLCNSHKFLQKVFVAELCLERLLAQDLAEPLYQSPERFPFVEQDLSFMVDRKSEYAKIVSAVKALSIGELQGVKLIDLYQGSELSKGKISLTLRLTFVDPERTLTQDIVNECTGRVFSVLKSRFAAEVRSPES